MAQGFFGGMTPYEDQSLKEIQMDINQWMSYAEEIQAYFKDNIRTLQDNNYLNNIPYNLMCVFRETIRKTETFLYDFGTISNSISVGRITQKDVTLLKNIGSVSFKTNREYGMTYHEETRWHDYDNSDFRLAEQLYQKGRDFFVTLQDAANAAARLGDYVSTDSSNITNYVVNGTRNNIQQGSHMTMNIQNGSSIDTQEINKLLNQLLDDLDKYFSEDQFEEKQEAEEYIEVIQGQIVEEQPKKGLLKTALNGLKALNDSATFVSTVAGISQILGFLPK